MKRLIKNATIMLILSCLCLSGCSIVVDRGGVTTECTDHDFSPADCTSPAKCKNCGLTRGENAPHTFGDAGSTDSVCISNGKVTHTCAVCGENVTETIEIKAYSMGEMHDHSEASVCVINTYDQNGTLFAFGTGFVIGEDGRIITNYHVIEGADILEISLDGATYYTDKLLAYDKDADIAMLKIDATGLKPLDICGLEHHVGTVVYAVGTPRGLESTITEGKTTSAYRSIEGIQYIQHNAVIAEGSSGGPLINEYGEVIGINTFRLEDAQGFYFAVSMKELARLAGQTETTLGELIESQYSAAAADFADSLELLRDHIKDNGDYYSDYQYYSLDISYYPENGLNYFRMLNHYMSDNSSSFCSSVEDSEGEFFAFVELFVDESGTPYLWEYEDSDNDYIIGYLDPQTYTSYADIVGDDTNITDNTAYEDALYIAWILINESLNNMDADLVSIGLDSDNFGFVHF